MVTLEQRRVRRGARLFDRKQPGWAMRIDRPRLDVGDPYNCPLGQLYGGYCEGLKALGLWCPSRYGFIGPILPRLPRLPLTESHRRLTLAWRAEIARRLCLAYAARVTGSEIAASELAEAAV